MAEKLIDGPQEGWLHKEFEHRLSGQVVVVERLISIGNFGPLRVQFKDRFGYYHTASLFDFVNNFTDKQEGALNGKL